MTSRHKDKWPEPHKNPTKHVSIQNYMEKQLTDLHYTSADYNLFDKIQSFILGSSILILLPLLHIGVFYKLIWVPDKSPVDKNTCTNTCFDTVFRGQYENPGPVSYKHVYFNATKETLRIWILTVIFMLMAYESIKYLYRLFRCGHMRKSMFILYLANIYPHYYSWWVFFNYYNEEIYEHYANQLFFTITEIISSVVVLNLCNAANSITSWKILIILTINCMHIMVSASDQFITHVFHGRGRAFQNARNIGLMIPDVLHIIIPLYNLYRFAKTNRLGITDLFYKEEILLCLIAATFGTLIGNIL